MGRLAERYSDRQKRALTSEHLDNRTPLKACISMLAAGDLVDGYGRVPPIDMPRSTAQSLAKAERARRRAKRTKELSEHDPSKALGEAYTFAVATVHRELDRLEKKSKSATLSAVDVSKLEKLTKIARDAHGKATPPKSQEPKSDFQAKLERKHRETMTYRDGETIRTPATEIALDSVPDKAAEAVGSSWENDPGDSGVVRRRAEAVGSDDYLAQRARLKDRFGRVDLR